MRRRPHRSAVRAHHPDYRSDRTSPKPPRPTPQEASASLPNNPTAGNPQTPPLARNPNRYPHHTDRPRPALPRQARPTSDRPPPPSGAKEHRACTTNRACDCRDRTTALTRLQVAMPVRQRQQVSTATGSRLSQIAKGAHRVLAGRGRFRANAALGRMVATPLIPSFVAAPAVVAAWPLSPRPGRRDPARAGDPASASRRRTREAEAQVHWPRRR